MFDFLRLESKAHLRWMEHRDAISSWMDGVMYSYGLTTYAVDGEKGFCHGHHSIISHKTWPKQSHLGSAFMTFEADSG